MGILIPSTVVKSSPTEYLQVGCNPLSVLLENFGCCAGILIVWTGIYYWHLNKSGRLALIILQWIFTGICLLNFFFFNKNGVINPNMTFSWGFVPWSIKSVIINFVFVLGIIILFYLLLKKFSEYIKGIAFVLLLTLGALSVFNVVDIYAQLKDYEIIHKDEKKVEAGILELSKKGKNVVFIMLDRAASEFVPYIMYEKPEIKEQFSGFVYYPNVLSFGDTTIYASPGAYGGYEYTPEQMNKRANDLLKDKQNEALLLLPTIFSEAGFSVTTCDPPYANYEIVPDLRIFNNSENIKAYNVLSSDLYIDVGVTPDMSDEIISNNFMMYSLMKVSPVFLQEFIYDEGNYRRVLDKPFSTAFLKSYQELDQLKYLTSLSHENEVGSLLMIYNCLTHEPVYLQLPDYEITTNVNNSEFETMNRISEKGEILDLSAESVRTHYYSAVVALQKLGEWFDFLKQNGVYDNSRIIILGDHAFPYSNQSSKITSYGHHIESLNPVYFVKDFYATEFSISDEFITLADTAAICMEGLVDNPVNPFSQIPLTVSTHDRETSQKVLFSEGIDMDKVWYGNNTFLSKEWYLVENNALDISKYHKIDEPHS